MAGSINRATLLGNVGKDPEIRTMNSGDRVANFSIATSESWRDKQSGEKKERTQWHNVVAWGPVVDVIEKYVSKGSKVLVEGSIETRSWEKDGEKKYTTEIVMRGFGSQLVLLGEPKGDGGRRESQSNDDRGYSGGGFSSSGGDDRGYDQRGNPRETFSADLDDEIPF